VLMNSSHSAPPSSRSCVMSMLPASIEPCERWELSEEMRIISLRRWLCRSDQDESEAFDDVAGDGHLSSSGIGHELAFRPRAGVVEKRRIAILVANATTP
jgi:hypothetical protein